MKFPFSQLLVGVLISLLTVSCLTKTKVDLIIHNATIYVVDEEHTIHEAMAVKAGKIVAVGKENQILNKYSATEKIDVQNQYVYPGFIDAHCHFLGYGLTLQQVNLIGCQSFEEVVERCINFEKTNQSEWLTGRGWDNTLWDDKSFPSKEELDVNFPNKPVLIRRVDGHAAVANQVALDLANINLGTEVSGGTIGVKDGQLTGILVDNAVDLVLDIIPKPTLAEKKKALLAAQRNCFEVGLTTVDDAGLDKEDVELIEKLHQTEELKMRIYAMLTDSKENFDYYLDTVGEPFRTERLTVNAFKFYGDGALGSRGACLLRPYTDIADSSVYGMLLNDTAYFQKYAGILHEKGFQMCTHAIGDSTARFILNTYAKALKGTNDRRWRIEHAQIIDSSDFRLFADYSVVPSVQPTHATSDMKWAFLRLGKKRVRFGYAYQNLLHQNGWLPLGTDFPIEGIDPLTTFYAAVARKNKDGLPKNGFQIENALSRIQALKGMTIWAALSNFEEEVKGSLEVNKLADFVILNRDILTVEEDELLKARVTATYINGEKVF
ncbi:MAG: amidohydrolase [Flavobacteriales bacterium]|jgi:predicted amidohydrolase YtcJ|nr:amidohydrolase [Flavobacteriales bacterium]